jgi:hypothetical protein
MGRLSRQGSVASGGGTPQPEPDALLTHPIDGGADRLWLRAVSRFRYQEVESRLAPIQEVESSLIPGG